MGISGGAAPGRPLLYSKAVPRLMPYWTALPDLDRSRPTLIGHTNGGPSDHGSLFGWFSRAGNDVCAHFQVMLDGTVEQYVPLNKQAYAQYDGNGFAWSVEHQDDGDPTKPLTAAQLVAFADIADELGVPRVLASVAGPGIGWHSLHPAEWNRSGHDCPGPVRAAQFQALIDEGDDVPLSDADIDKIAAKVVTALKAPMKAAQDTVITHVRDDKASGIAAVLAKLAGK